MFAILISYWQLIDKSTYLYYYGAGVLVNFAIFFITKYLRLRPETKPVSIEMKLDEYGLFSLADYLQINIYSLLYTYVITQRINYFLLSLTAWSAYENVSNTFAEIAISIVVGLVTALVMAREARLNLRDRVRN